MHWEPQRRPEQRLHKFHHKTTHNGWLAFFPSQTSSQDYTYWLLPCKAPQEQSTRGETAEALHTCTGTHSTGWNNGSTSFISKLHIMAGWHSFHHRLHHKTTHTGCCHAKHHTSRAHAERLLRAHTSALGTKTPAGSTASHGPHLPHAHMSQRIRLIAHVLPQSPILQPKQRLRPRRHKFHHRTTHNGRWAFPPSQLSSQNYTYWLVP